MVYQKLYRLVFWVGFVMVFAEAFMTLKVNLHKITMGVVSIKFHLDQVLHTTVYFLICMYFLTGEYLGLKLFRNRSFIKFLVVVLISATLTEVVQLWVPERSCNFFDWLANVVGIGIGVMVILGVRHRASGIRKKRGGDGGRGRQGA
jgi:hypothetical protein